MSVVSNRGFSLIELLVVVVIIGVLASAGFVAYQSYIDSSRDGVSSDRTAFINRSIDNDLVSIRNDLHSRSALAKVGSTEIKTTSYCEAYRDNIVAQLNNPTGDNDKKLTNPFTGRKVACDGNAVADYFNKVSSVDKFQVDRGSTIIYCQNKGESIDSPGFGLLTCSCTGPEPCMTEPRPKGNTIHIDNGSGYVLMDNSSPQVQGTTVTKLKIAGADLAAYANRLQITEDGLIGGKIIMRVDDNVTRSQEFAFSSVVKNSANDYEFLPLGTNKLAVDTKALNNATVYINQTANKVCWTPKPYISGSSPTPAEIDRVNCIQELDPSAW